MGVYALSEWRPWLRPGWNDRRSLSYCIVLIAQTVQGTKHQVLARSAPEFLGLELRRCRTDRRAEHRCRTPGDARVRASGLENILSIMHVSLMDAYCRCS